MTKKTEALARKIEAAQQAKIKKALDKPQNAYQFAFDVLTNLFGCVLMGLALGVLFQNLFQTPALLTVGLAVFGSFVGLYQVVRQAIEWERKGKV